MRGSIHPLLLYVFMAWCLVKHRDNFTFYWQDLSIDGRIILKESKGKKVGRCGLDSSGSGQRPVAGSCEHCNETSGSIKGEIC
jgi:hypothetical protein